MVPLAGLEPARCFHHLILSQARLPIPPQGHRLDRAWPNELVERPGPCAARIIAAERPGSTGTRGLSAAVMALSRPPARPYDGLTQTIPQEKAMNEEALNSSLRKFLKVVGVTSQSEIEKAVRAAADAGKQI